MDLDGNLREANDDLAPTASGYTREEVVDRPFWSTAVAQHLVEDLAGGGSHQGGVGTAARRAADWIQFGSDWIQSSGICYG